MLPKTAEYALRATVWLARAPDLAESAAADRDLADTIEVQIASEADELVQSFIQ